MKVPFRLRIKARWRAFFRSRCWYCRERKRHELSLWIHARDDNMGPGAVARAIRRASESLKDYDRLSHGVFLTKGDTYEITIGQVAEVKRWTPSTKS